MSLHERGVAFEASFYSWSIYRDGPMQKNQEEEVTDRSLGRIQ